MSELWAGCPKLEHTTLPVVGSEGMIGYCRNEGQDLYLQVQILLQIYAYFFVQKVKNKKKI